MIPIIAVLILFGGCALQQDLAALDDRVTALEQRANRASLQSEKGQLEFRDRHAELHALMNDLREEMGRLRGEQEKSEYDVRKRIADLENSEAKREAYWKSLEKSRQRIVRIEEHLGLEPSEKLAALRTDQDKDVKKGKSEIQETPEGLYARAKQLFDKGEYENARGLFGSFLELYPRSKKADNAQFWLGEIYYHEKWYEKAILEYQKVIENYPREDKISGALLKQGFAFLNLDDEANAQLILKELIRKFPDSKEANVAKNKLKTLR
ncbi:MAG: tol-pal system protein YbgF [Desulfobacterales bacterium]|nr:tol-pal system protein YbgF [Desulfobacterales bacterium]